MAIWTRDYMREGSAPGVRPRWLGPVELIIALNIIVFLAWQVAPRGARADLLVGHFMTSAEYLAEGRVWTLLTAAFSHVLSVHILCNMLVLYSFGAFAIDRLGRRGFWTFYLSAAVIASLVNDAIAFWHREFYDVPMLGASGAVVALCVLFGLTNPRAKLHLFGLVPLPALVVVVIATSLDVVGLFYQFGGGMSHIGHGAHLGGAAFGAGWWYFSARLPSEHDWRAGRARRDAGEPAIDSAELDRILAKISREGVHKLGVSEREFLEKASRRYRRDQ